MRWYTGGVSAQFVFNHGLWRCSTEIDGHPFYAVGRTPTEALHSLELQLLGIPVIYAVHIDLTLE